MLFKIWLVAIISFTFYFKNNMTKKQKRQIESTTFVDEVIVDGKKKRIIKDKCPKCGNKKMHYKGARKTAVYEYKFAVCDECGTSFRVMHEPSKTNGIFAFFFSFSLCTIVVIILFFVI